MHSSLRDHPREHSRMPPLPTTIATDALTSISDRKSTRLNSSHLVISYAVFCLKKNALHHKALNQALIFMSFSGTHRRIKVANSESPEAVLLTDRFTVPGHITKVRPATHASCNV